MEKTIIMLGRVSTSIKAGIPVHVLSIINALSSAKNISIINIVPSLDNYSKRQHRQITSNSIEVICPANFAVKTLSLSLDFLFYFKSICNRYPSSPIHVHLPDPLSLIAILLFARHRKVFYTVHAELVGKGVFSLIYNLMLLSLDSRHSSFVFPTKSHRESIHIPKRFKNSIELPFIFEDPLYPDSMSCIRAKTNTSSTVLTFVGRLVPYKGVEVLIRAMAMVPQSIPLSLNIVGDGPMRADLQVAASQDLRIKFSGEISDTQLSLLYSQTHIFVLPSISRAEAFGIVQVEAMLHACMVLSSYLGNGVNDVNQESISGHSFPAGNSAALAELIIQYSTDQSARNSLMLSARKYAKTRFASQSLLDSYLHLYK